MSILYGSSETPLFMAPQQMKPSIRFYHNCERKCQTYLQGIRMTPGSYFLITIIFSQQSYRSSVYAIPTIICSADG